jgi:hypothetical protein
MMDTVSPLGVAAVALGGVLIGVGILLVVVAFVIKAIEATRPKVPGPAPAADIWDFMVELAKRVELLYIPGIILIVLGIVLILGVLSGANPFTTGGTPNPTSVPTPSAS